VDLVHVLAAGQELANALPALLTSIIIVQNLNLCISRIELEALWNTAVGFVMCWTGMPRLITRKIIPTREQAKDAWVGSIPEDLYSNKALGILHEMRPFSKRLCDGCAQLVRNPKPGNHSDQRWLPLSSKTDVQFSGGCSEALTGA
jgi:hypothetical protein